MRGNRAVSSASVLAQRYHLPEQQQVSRKDLQKAGRDAAQALELPSNLRSVLSELLAVWGEQEIKGKLLVWPSNDYLQDRTGLSERSVRYCLSKLIGLKLIASKDSANGKRFSIRNKAGYVIDAFGFDLTPLFQRKKEFQNKLGLRDALRASLARMFDLLTATRRGVEELLTSHLTQFPKQSIDVLTTAFEDLRKSTPKRSLKAEISALNQSYDLWIDLKARVENSYLEAGYGGKECRHIETDNESLAECNNGIENVDERINGLNLEILKTACPAIKSYYAGELRTTRELVAAAEFLRPLIGAHASAWDESLVLLGPVQASVVLLWTLQVFDDDQTSGRKQIHNPGGYFRAMVRLTANRKINLAFELMQLSRKRSPVEI